MVDKEGNIKAVIPITHHGFGMEEEVIRVMKLSPKWTPARQNGKIVNAYKMQAVTFLMRENELSKVQNKKSIIKDYGNPANWDYQDTAFMNWRRNAINEIIAIARVEGKAAYFYKGRTYVFGRIINSDSTVASFTEQNGTDHVFLLNDELINSVDELNTLIKRSDVKRFGFMKQEEALNRFNRKDAVVFIETYDEVITRN